MYLKSLAILEKAPFSLKKPSKISIPRSGKFFK
jgi:hypothetical protein